MRVLHLVSSSARRGAETFAVNLSRELVDRGVESNVIALTESDQLDRLPVPALGRSRRSMRSLIQLRNEARQADVVVAHGSITLEASAIALLGSGTPFIYRTIGDPSYWVRGRLRRQTIGVLQRQATRHVTLWLGAAEQLTARYQIRPDLIDVIPNGVPSAQFPEASDKIRESARRRLDIGSETICLGYVGSLSPEKNVATAIHAIRQLADVHLIIAGDGPEQTMLKELSQTIAPGRVHFLDAVVDPYPVYAAADLMVLPSLSEGMPAVIIEAALVGVATIATRVGAVPEMIKHGHDGWIVPPGNTSSLKAAIMSVLPNSSAMGKSAASNFRNRYSLSRVVDLWMRTLESGIHSRQP